jgi:AraC-like DNA-binding protein
VVDFAIQRVRVRTNICTLQTREQGYELLPRVISDYNFIYCTRGRAVWIIEKKEFPLSPGELVFVSPHVQHRGHSLTRRMTIGSVHVEVLLPNGQDLFALLAPPVLRSVAPGSMLDFYLRGAMREFTRENAGDRTPMLSSWGRLVTIELLRHDFAADLLDYRPGDPLVAAVLDELIERREEALTLAELAGWSGYSPQHLNRVFRKALGVTPLRHHARLRMERAAELLRDETLTIAAVARRLGFDDPYYFSRLFKQQMGVSPARHRLAVNDQELNSASKRG